jgi:hypothetical protein
MYVKLDAMYVCLFRLLRLELLVLLSLFTVIDLWTSPVLSVFGFKYFLVILDDFTHFIWTIPLCQKSDAYASLACFCAFAHTQFICLLRTSSVTMVVSSTTPNSTP